MALTQISTSTLSNQNISSALLVHTYTNTSRVRKVYIAVDADQIAGNGSYTLYATIQRGGSGSAFRVSPVSTVPVASGQTSATFPTIAIILNATDVLKVYLLGLAGDTTTPDITTRVWEENNPTVDEVWTTALTEAYRATGATGTGAQLLYELLNNIADFVISGTTKTTKKIDGTTAKTYELNSATSPTSITEST